MKNDEGLTLKWSKREKDLMVYFPRKPDGNLVLHIFCSERPSMNYDTGKIEFEKSFEEELIARGYDITTLKFSVKLKEIKE